VLAALGLAAVLIVIGSSISLDNVWLSALVKLPLVLLYPLVVWRLGWFRFSAPLFRQPARA
jgi:hypothetical protein